MPHTRHKKAFSLLEVVIALAVFLIFALGIYGGIQMVFKIVYQSRLRIIETALLNEQVETIRNLSFFDVGIINGSPSGMLTRNVTTTRNGIDFLVTRTIRNIDDPYDGTVTTTPRDTAPADYKLVDISVVCIYCAQTTPLSIQTYISPKLLEGDPAHGALFIEVFDADVNPVQGAQVHVTATTPSSTIDLVDTTDNDGMLRLVDLPAGSDAYHISVSKTGYTTDGTLVPSESVPHPEKPPATVSAQDVTEISFSIDIISSINLQTVNAQCQPVGNISFHVVGTHLLGRNDNEEDNEIYKIDNSYTTNGSGLYDFSSFEWDNYLFSVSGKDMLGSIPYSPLKLMPGSSQPVQLVVGPNTERSLLVIALDNISDQPVASATVHIATEGYDATKITSIGNVRQTDWSGGGGQTDFIDETKYFTDDGNIDVYTSTGNVTLRKIGQEYVSYGSFESSIFDLGAGVHYVNLIWEPLAQPVDAGNEPLKFQIATSPSSTPAEWEYFGYDGTSATYYDSTHTAIHEIHDNGQYFRYKVFMQTNSVTTTPTLSDVVLTYTNSCTPPGQAFFPNLISGPYTITVTADGYQLYTTTVNLEGETSVGAKLVAS